MANNPLWFTKRGPRLDNKTAEILPIQNNLTFGTVLLPKNYECYIVWVWCSSLWLAHLQITSLNHPQWSKYLNRSQCRSILCFAYDNKRTSAATWRWYNNHASLIIDTIAKSNRNYKSHINEYLIEFFILPLMWLTHWHQQNQIN